MDSMRALGIIATAELDAPLPSILDKPLKGEL
jgi:hypothetical protein